MSYYSVAVIIKSEELKKNSMEEVLERVMEPFEEKEFDDNYENIINKYNSKDYCMIVVDCHI